MIYNENNVVSWNGDRYEKLFDHPDGQTWRIIFSDDDYDYVEDSEIIEVLNDVWNKEQDKK